MFFSVVVPDCTQISAFFSCLALLTFDFLATMKPWPS
jgi:hypothetical protein